jgi:hypothetical protein
LCSEVAAREPPEVVARNEPGVAGYDRALLLLSRRQTSLPTNELPEGQTQQMILKGGARARSIVVVSLDPKIKEISHYIFLPHSL